MKINQKIVVCFIVVAALAGISAFAPQATMIISIAIVALTICFGFYLSFSISRNIGKLNNALMNLDGEFDTPIEIDSKDEIGDLSRVIDKLMQDLKTSGSLNRAEVERDVISEVIQGVTTTSN